MASSVFVDAVIVAGMSGDAAAAGGELEAGAVEVGEVDDLAVGGGDADGCAATEGRRGTAPSAWA